MIHTRFFKKYLSKILQIIFVFTILFSTIWGAAGNLDTSFNGSVYKYPAGDVFILERQPDGKILVVTNNSNIINGKLKNIMFRLNADYSLDTSFNVTQINIQNNGSIQDIAVQSDGKIIVAGDITALVGNTLVSRLVRLNQDGSLDTSFQFYNITALSGWIRSVEVLPNDKILIGGTFAHFQIVNFARLNANGELDSTFNINTPNNLLVADILVQPDGKILGSFVNNSPSGIFLKRLNQDGTIDESFNTLLNGLAGGVIGIQSDGKILITGNFSFVNNIPKTKLARLNTDGSLDETFTLDPAIGSISDLTVDANDKIIISGRLGSSSELTLNRLNNDGSIDSSFNFVSPTGQPLTIRDILSLPDGRLIIGGSGFIEGNLGGQVYLLDQNGSVNPALNVKIGERGTVWSIAAQSDGKVIVGGFFSAANSITKYNLARFDENGQIDETFQPDISISGIRRTVNSISIQPNEKIVLGINGAVLRLNTDGSRDSSFVSSVDTQSQINFVKVLGDGKILAAGNLKIAGESSFRYIARFNQDGTVDNTFQTALPNAQVFSAAVQSDGKIVIGGNFTIVGGSQRRCIARLNSDGSLDNSFNPLGGASSTVYSVGLQSDGKIIIGGAFVSVNGTPRKYLARMNSNGTLDTGFNVNLDASLSSVKVQSDDKIYIGGSFSTVNGVSSRGLARLRANGTYDSTFSVGTGTDGVVNVFEPLANDKLMIGGTFTLYNNNERLSIARLENNLNAVQRTPFDFDGDGKSDISVFRSSTNRWYEFLSGNSSVFEATFGASGDVLAPADFDGDGKTDLAVFRPSTGSWWYQSSVTNAQISVQFGAAGDIPRPSDFDGDGKDDFIVFRPSNNAWYRFGSTGTVDIDVFGTNGDKPLVGDFDGDGQSDLAVYRPSTGTWWYQASSSGAQRAAQFGVATDIPVPADYDGDGTTDLAIFRPSNGVWYILNSSNGQATVMQFGISEDKPVAADYDGDGKADISVFRPSTGVWYLQRSAEGFTAFQFGISTDLPIPNSFIQ